ncbi:MAG: GntR family transcriptional regulator, N-acetylglucosamine utilization regulator [Kosmotogales bacterium]|nr:GntR family transcriptional regulator, N-acetylglucosamine utilization regulator [Kosmotogales bacterium]
MDFTKENIYIDQNSAMPLFQQIFEWFKNAINNNLINEGEKLPSEVELCNKFNVSRITIRQALTKLKNEGFIERKQGKGTIVVNNSKLEFSYINQFFGVGEELKRKGVQLSDKVLLCKVLKANEELATKLFINPKEKVFVLKRVRIINKIPSILSYNYVPYKFVPDIEKIDFTKNFLYTVLEKNYNMHIDNYIRTFKPVIINKEEAKLLDYKSDEPVMKMLSTSYDSKNNIVEYYYGIQRGDIGNLTIKMKRVRY